MRPLASIVTMKHFAPLILIQLVLISCSSKSSSNLIEEVGVSSFPKIIVLTERDSVKIGNHFRARVFLSDSSFYYFVDDMTGEKKATNPVFRVNGEMIYSESDTLQYEEIVTDSIIYDQFPYIREISFGVIFPHPEPSQGEIEIGIRHTYIAIE